MRINPLLALLLCGPGLTAVESSDTWTAPMLQEPDNGFDDPFAIQAGDWRLSIGISGEYEPAYLGSDDAEFDVRPQLSALYWFHPRFGVGIGGQQAGFIYRPLARLWLEAGVGYLDGREGDDSDDLDGLEDIEDGFGLGLAARAFPIGELEIQLTALQDFTSDRHGLSLELEASYEWELTDTIEWGLEVGVAWADATRNRSWYGITPEQSAASAYDVFEVGAGLQNAVIALELEWEPTRRWEFEAEFAFSHLIGDVKDSPLVQQDYAFEVELGVNFNL